MEKVSDRVGEYCRAAKKGVQPGGIGEGEFGWLVGREKYKIAMARDGGDEGMSLRTALEALRV